MKPHAKTNALRILESLRVPFEVATYDVGEEHVEASAVARALGVSPEILWKTLVAQDEKENHVVFCIPAAAELDLKKAARAIGARKVDLINLKDLTPLTGYMRGGCSPIGMKKNLPTWIDEIALTMDRIYVNAGARGMQVLLAPEDLVRVVDARVADIV